METIIDGIAWRIAPECFFKLDTRMKQGFDQDEAIRQLLAEGVFFKVTPEGHIPHICVIQH